MSICKCEWMYNVVRVIWVIRELKWCVMILLYYDKECVSIRRVVLSYIICHAMDFWLCGITCCIGIWLLCMISCALGKCMLLVLLSNWCMMLCVLMWWHETRCMMMTLYGNMTWNMMMLCDAMRYVSMLLFV